MASIDRTKAGTYRVRFRTPEGASRSKTFPRRAQADAFAATVEVSKLAGHRPDARRFRPNLLISSLQSDPFEEDTWVGGSLSFGDGDAAATIAITDRDERCSMVNFDPDSARHAPEVLKAVARERDNKAGVYGTVIWRGRLAVGQPVYYRSTVEHRKR